MLGKHSTYFGHSGHLQGGIQQRKQHINGLLKHRCAILYLKNGTLKWLKIILNSEECAS
jgi:hypothetical protein